MEDRAIARSVWGFYAGLLDYPTENPLDAIEECRSLVVGVSSEADALLARFQEFVEGSTLGRLQEEYTRAFDMDESHSLYVGYHLLGESYKRSAMLLEFMERYRAHGVEVAGELADYLPVILRFLTVCDDCDLVDEIVCDAIWPSLEMISKDDNADDADPDEEGPPVAAPLPYHELLDSLLLFVRASTSGSTQPLAATTAVGWPTT
ncbi:MAG TPA: nitrate reductase molybdenum cofactor assembly chaperone [Acidimicrobiales bacterium]|nr:nitrate reductase molybdenum cofactor assembly chaperone [Acidimicrobiales bacterium]